MESKDAKTSAGAERRKRSIARLKSEGVPVNEFLLAIEDGPQVKRRSLEEVAYRAMAAMVVALKGEGLEQQIIDEMIEKYRLAGRFSPKEQAFLEELDPSQHDRIQFSWRYEAVYTLFWALGFVDVLNKPTSICDVPWIAEEMARRSLEQFLSEAKLRPMSEILEQTDLIYRYHWAVVDARINGRSPPADLDPGVTMERHYAVNWLIGYLDQAWDDVTTDT